MTKAAPLFLLLLLAAACAAPPAPRDSASARRGIEEAKEREPYLPMVSEEAAREAIPGFRGKEPPALVRVAAHLPKTWAAEMAAWQALGEEGTVDRELLAEVFYVVSSANDCFYCMGHSVMTGELGGKSEAEVLCIEETKDPMRQTIFSYARKASRAPETVTRADVEALRPHLTDAQIVELDLAICRFCTMNRLALVFGVPLERENVFAPATPPPGAATGPGSGGAQGFVNAVRGNLVGVSAGSADKVRVGDYFSLSRGSAWVGRVVITAVDRNQSVGEFDAKFAGSGAPPQVGDKATLTKE